MLESHNRKQEWLMGMKSLSQQWEKDNNIRAQREHELSLKREKQTIDLNINHK